MCERIVPLNQIWSAGRSCSEKIFGLPCPLSSLFFWLTRIFFVVPGGSRSGRREIDAHN